MKGPRKKPPPLPKIDVPKNAVGRPQVLDDEVQHQILVLVRAGNYAETAARAVGIRRETFWAWKRRGESSTKGKYRDFSNAVDQADALGEARLLAKCVEGGRGAYGALEILSRKYIERYGRRIALVPPPSDRRTRMDIQIEVVETPVKKPAQIIDASADVKPGGGA